MSLWEGDYNKSSPSPKPTTTSSSSSASSSSSSLPLNNMYLERIGNYFVLPEKCQTTNVQRTICDGDDMEGDDEDDEEHHRRAIKSCPDRTKTDTQINLSSDNSILLPRILIKNNRGVKGSSNTASSNDDSGFDRCYNNTLSVMGKKKKSGNCVNVNNNVNHNSHNNNSHNNNNNSNNHHVNGNFYSTDKSGSSGYYGSNLYSTSSFDDHIYSEPVIDHYNCNILMNNSSSNSNNTLTNGNYGNSLKLIDKLPTIMEGVDGQIPRPVWPIDYDDSLIDINLESFLIQNSNNNNTVNENSASNSNNGHYNLGFDHNELPMINTQHTREILEEICFKLNNLLVSEGSSVENDIKLLKNDLNEYIKIINKNSDVEIRKLCDNLSKNTKMLTIKNALENQRNSNYNYNEYNNIVFNTNHIYRSSSGSHYGKIKRQQSIRSVNDPNFHFQTKFPSIIDHIGIDLHNNSHDLITNEHDNNNINNSNSSNIEDDANHNNNKPILSANIIMSSDKNMINTAKNHDHDKNMILEWHRNKPSIWEMYYGKNRPPQTIIKKIRCKRNTKNKATQAVIAYPSSRPESDFTLDLPRAEQLRIKMKKEKKFRNRCRIVMTFFSLIFFLLTVMGVSLILTRGKRMFGSML